MAITRSEEAIEYEQEYAPGDALEYTDERESRKRGTTRYCSQPAAPVRELPTDLGADRIRLIRTNQDKWVNGTVLHYYFFDRKTDGRTVTLTNGKTEFRMWAGSKAEKDIVRRAFSNWKALGIGLEFVEVKDRSEAEVRIGFERGDGAWSYVGRGILGQGVNERTMNFGWSLLDPGEIDTAIHEIGHTLGFEHEHQNPFAGIVWNVEAVYASLAQPPNEWDRETTFQNIIRKIPAASVKGSSWDPNSVMEYPFEAGLIREPAPYRNGLQPAGGLSAADKTWTLKFYPSLTPADHTPLQVFQAVSLDVAAGDQRNFEFVPDETRVHHVRTFGSSDAVVVLFEEVNGDLRYVAGDDDSAEPRNAELEAKLFKGRRYVVRVRVYAQQSSNTAIMMW
jgi:hypothetical protein